MVRVSGQSLVGLCYELIVHSADSGVDLQALGLVVVLRPGGY